MAGPGPGPDIDVMVGPIANVATKGLGVGQASKTEGTSAMTQWRRSMDTSIGVTIGLGLAGSLNDGARLWAILAAIVVSFICIVVVRRADYSKN
ncbi:MAG: hypothetical protein DCF28_09670 [Alphaproteobacteria bacterium]|nr:MAG: hypothetical protein DCF28_09670 [Alphaproteobacteria bacterium]PZO34916.1 MAG: hypothetical protein DCE92_11280 [Alphaproteobacteria bacterium]